MDIDNLIFDLIVLETRLQFLLDEEKERYSSMASHKDEDIIESKKLSEGIYYLHSSIGSVKKAFNFLHSYKEVKNE